MARLIYSAIASLDGYVADRDGNLHWAEPDEEVFRFLNELERPIGTYLLGRRMYETLLYWKTALDHPDQPSGSGFRRDLAGGREGRRLDHPDRSVQCQDAGRTSLRSERGPRDEGVRGA